MRMHFIPADETVLGIALVIGVVVTENLNGIVEQFEFNALFHCMFNFLTASGKFLKGTAINDIDLVRTEAQRSPCSIHCNVAAADDRNVSALHEWGHGISPCMPS